MTASVAATDTGWLYTTTSSRPQSRRSDCAGRPVTAKRVIGRRRRPSSAVAGGLLLGDGLIDTQLEVRHRRVGRLDQPAPTLVPHRAGRDRTGDLDPHHDRIRVLRPCAYHPGP